VKTGHLSMNFVQGYTFFSGLVFEKV